MVTVIAVEPDTLFRLGILQLLEKMTIDITGTGIDYAELFESTAARKHVDLMLLSVPDVYERVAELAAAAQQRFDPKHILLLSNTPALTYSLLNLPSAVAGYISKRSSPEALDAAIRLVLAGGKCFPERDQPNGQGNRRNENAPGKSAAKPRRRWYDKLPVPPVEPRDSAPPPNLPTRVSTATPASERQSDILNAVAKSTKPGGTWPLPPALIAKEAEMLKLTRRQFEVLALLARGYSVKCVSRELGISTATTKVHTQTLYQRLGVHNSNAALHAAFENGATLGWYRLDAVDGERKQH